MTAQPEVSAVSVTLDGFRAINNLSLAVGNGEGQVASSGAPRCSRIRPSPKT